MVFSNLIFLYLFLPLCLAAYFLCRSVPAKNAVLIVFSLIFYAWGEPVYLFLMIAAAAVNWGFGLLIEKRHKRVFLVLALIADDRPGDELWEERDVEQEFCKRPLRRDIPAPDVDRVGKRLEGIKRNAQRQRQMVERQMQAKRAVQVFKEEIVV